MGGSQNCTPPIFLDLGSLAHGPKMGGAKKHPHVGPFGVSCPYFGFGLLRVSGVVG